MPYKPYIPQDVGELLDLLGYMMLASPTFKDDTGYFPERNIDTAFYALNEGLVVIRKKLGAERYAALTALSDKMRALFEADPNDSAGNARAGRTLIQEMRDILKSVTTQARSK